MNRPLAALALLLAALGLCLVALAAGALAALLAAPLGAGLLVLGLWLRRGAAPTQPPWVVGHGVLAALYGLALAGFGSPWAGLFALALGAGTAFIGSQLSLAQEAPPAGLPLPARRSLRTHAAVAADETLRFLGQVGSRLAAPSRLAEHAAALQEAAERHRALGWTQAPERAHPTPPALEKAQLATVQVRFAASATHLRFESEYEPQDPEIREGYLAVAANRMAHAYLWRHRDGPRPTLLCLHGYGMGRIGWDALAWDLRWLHGDLGLDVAALILPLHGPRASGRRSGAGFVGGHPLWTNAAMGQAVWELRRLSGWLRAEGAPQLGCYGIGLGGYLAALFASIERRLACAIPFAPFSSLAELLLRDLGEEQRLAREALGLTRSVLEDAWAPHAPLRHEPRVAPEGRLIVAGLADRISPPAQAHALWTHWGRPAVHWFPGSHLVPLGRREIRARIAAHLRRTLLAPPGEPLPLTRFRS